ncbi:MAG: UPF0182 family protein [Archaeoglobaceae archaeon]
MDNGIEISPSDKKVILGLVILILAIIFISTFINLYTEYLWFNSLNLGDYFLKIIFYRLELFGIVFIISAVILALNRLGMQSAGKEFLGEAFKVPLWIFILLALFIAYTLSVRWLDLVFFLHGQPFNVQDPIFNMDISFYVFKIPFIKDMLNVVLTTIIFCIMVSIIYYGFIFRWVKSWDELRGLFPFRGYLHVSILLSVIMILVGGYLFLYRFELLGAQHGVVNGANYTDVTIRMPVLLLLSVFSLIMAVLCIYFGYKGDLSPVSLVAATFILVLFVGLIVLPVGVQKIRVDPNELALEEKYIEYSIDFTQFAYSLGDVQENTYPISGNLTSKDIEENSGIINNIRLWDHRPLLSVYRQKQQIRTYYSINDIDIDRYNINGEYTQVMMAARELDPSLLQPNAQTWVNKHLVYTHGYGVIASPVNEVSEEGAPELITYDIPPRGEIEVERPAIYFGEEMEDYVIVNTGQKEFDYPSGDQNIFTTYQGTGGVPISNYFHKLLFTLRFSDINLLLTNYITQDSKILMHRDISERVNSIAPFLTYDEDPYVAVIDGRTYWIVDAYTTLDSFPYSERASLMGRDLDYVRNSVKIFIDAYNGSLRYYVMEDEPVVNTLQDAFPELFTSGENMSDDERSHIRYPVDLFKVQADIYSTYHMNDPQTFYNREDVWEIPYELVEDRRVLMEPYYVILTLSGGEPEFVLMLPFTPKGRDNIISWMAARCDENYGELVLYEFPKGTLVYGPMQVEARIDQDSSISQTFTLWGQVGSRVTRGNLLVIPIDNSIIYVEPVYLRAENAEIPELRGVIVAYGNDLTMQRTIMDSLRVVFGEEEEAELPVAGDIPSLVSRSIDLYERALEEIRSGNWSGFGDKLKELGDVLESMNRTVKQP